MIFLQEAASASAKEGKVKDIKKERLALVITTLSYVSCVLQTRFASWEAWVPFVVTVGIVVLWSVHFTQRLDMRARTAIYFAYCAFLVFYHGIHDTSMYEVSVATTLFMVTFTIFDSIKLVNAILLEYIMVMGIQFYFLYNNGGIKDLDAFTTMRIVFHVGAVATLYVFSRITISGRLSEQERIDEWHKTVEENGHDTEDFLSNISHELRTPVNVITGMTALLQKNEDREELDSIMKAGVRLSHQIGDIQDYTEIKRGELVLEEENYMVISLINDVVSIFNSYNNRKDLALIVDLSPETPSMLKGDIRKLHKLFGLLLDNAFKFTSLGGIYIRVFPVVREYGINLMIEVTDTGIGMTRADMSGVSKGMYQANKKRNRSTGGIGIGLPIVYGFVHKMGGFVKIESTRGSGTTVRLSIPQKIVDPAPCLALAEGATESLVMYNKPEKYKVPQLRDFYRNMAVDLAKGLKTRLYSTGDIDELLRMAEDVKISHIFTGKEEYESDHEKLDRLAENGCQVIVAANGELSVKNRKGVIVLPKPLYGFPIVRMLNNEYDANVYGNEGKGKVRFPGVRALIVDDEPMNLVVAGGLLREYGFIVDTAESGKESIAKYESGVFDVIFMDHMMPGMDGVEAMKRIRQVAEVSFRHPIFVALTANALSGAREMFMKEGFNGFVAKPIDIGEFERVMKNVLPEEMIAYEGRADR